MYLFLDDERDPHKVTHVQLPDVGTWTVVRNYDEFTKEIENYYKLYKELPEYISFDHDLADEHYRSSMITDPARYTGYSSTGVFKEKTGYDCAKWLVDFCLNHDLRLPKFGVHSMNPVGRQNIALLLNNFTQYRQHFACT